MVYLIDPRMLGKGGSCPTDCSILCATDCPKNDFWPLYGVPCTVLRIE